MALKEEKASLFDLFWSVLRFSSVEYQKGTLCVCVCVCVCVCACVIGGEGWGLRKTESGGINGVCE